MSSSNESMRRPRQTTGNLKDHQEQFVPPSFEAMYETIVTYIRFRLRRSRIQAADSDNIAQCVLVETWMRWPAILITWQGHPGRKMIKSKTEEESEFGKFWKHEVRQCLCWRTIDLLRRICKERKHPQQR